MPTLMTPPRLGHNILVIVEHSPAFLNLLDQFVSTLGEPAYTYVTLICCCPTVYWEHGGTAEASDEITRAWASEESDFRKADTCFKRARAILESAGIPAANIVTKTTANANTLQAIHGELRQSFYSSVVATRANQHLVQRLSKREWFQPTPAINAWAIEDYLAAQ